MTFFKTLISSIVILLLLAGISLSDSHNNEQNIIEKAKEINQKVKKQQASGVTNSEEPLPLNDPFVGDASMSGRTEVTLLENNNNTTTSPSSRSSRSFRSPRSSRGRSPPSTPSSLSGKKPSSSNKYGYRKHVNNNNSKNRNKS